MNTYKVTVIGTATQTVEYIIEAETPDGAKGEALEIADNDEESFPSSNGDIEWETDTARVERVFADEHEPARNAS